MIGGRGGVLTVEVLEVFHLVEVGCRGLLNQALRVLLWLHARARVENVFVMIDIAIITAAIRSLAAVVVARASSSGDCVGLLDALARLDSWYCNHLLLLSLLTLRTLSLRAGLTAISPPARQSVGGQRGNYFFFLHLFRP